MISCQDNENQLRYQKKKMFGHKEEDNKEKLKKKKKKKKTHIYFSTTEISKFNFTAQDENLNDK